MKKVSVFPNRYMDSVTLMGVAFQLADMDGVNGAECGMGTAQNVALLKEEGYEVAESVSKNDLLLAIDAESKERLDQVYQAGVELLSGNGGNKQKKVYRDVN